MKTEAFAAADSAWWRMEEPANLMMITGVLTFDEPLDLARVRTMLQRQLVERYDRFRMKVVESRRPLVGGLQWVEDEAFSLDHHLELVTLEAPGDRPALQRLVSRLMSTPLDYRRPLWQFHYVDNYRHGSALIARLHHCIADGMALVQVLLSLDDSMETAAGAAHPGPPTRGHRRMESMVNLDRLLSPFRTVLGVTAVLARLLLMGADRDTLFRGELSQNKVAVWSEPISLDRIKFIGRRLGGTVNDVLLSTVAGALRTYLDRRGRDLEHGESLRAVVPVNLRRPGEPLTLGNRFGLVFLTLPVGTGDPVERLHALKRHMDRLKQSPEALVIFGLLRILGKAAERLLVAVVNLLGRNATAVMTNVPGPREPVCFAGQQIRSLMFWVPQSGRLGLGVSVLSYTGQVRIGVATDARLVPDPERLIEAYNHALAELMDRAEQVAVEAR